MTFIDNLPPAFRYGFLLLIAYWGYVLWRNWRRAKTEYKDIAYSVPSQNEADGWRWITPPDEVGLNVEQDDVVSRLSLQPVRSINEVFFSICGMALAALTVYVLGIILLADKNEAVMPPGMALTMLIIMALMSYGLCAVDAPVKEILRSENTLVFKIRFAAFFQRSVTFTRRQAKSLSFDGNLQNFLAMNTDQLDRLPDFYLYAKRRFRPSKRFLLRSTPSQTSWTVGGLNQWLNSEQK